MGSIVSVAPSTYGFDLNFNYECRNGVFGSQGLDIRSGIGTKLQAHVNKHEDSQNHSTEIPEQKQPTSKITLGQTLDVPERHTFFSRQIWF